MPSHPSRKFTAFGPFAEAARGDVGEARAKGALRVGAIDESDDIPNIGVMRRRVSRRSDHSVLCSGRRKAVAGATRAPKRFAQNMARISREALWSAVAPATAFECSRIGRAWSDRRIALAGIAKKVLSEGAQHVALITQSGLFLPPLSSARESAERGAIDESRWRASQRRCYPKARSTSL
jgi:hypothetical protein